jgi:hypothetical protein
MGVHAVYIKACHQFGSAHQDIANADAAKATGEATDADSLPQQDDKALDYLLISHSLFTFSPKDRPRLCDATKSRGGLWLQSPHFPTDDKYGTGCTLSLSLACLFGIGEVAHNNNNQSGDAWTSLHVGDASFIVNMHIATCFAAIKSKLGQGPGPVAHTEFPPSSLAFPHVWAPQDESSKVTKFVSLISANTQHQVTDSSAG